MKIEVWLVIVALSLFISAFLSLYDYFLFEKSIAMVKLGSRVIQAFSASFGGDFLADDFQKSARIAMLSFFGLGLLVWNYYQSFIISGLADKRPQYPFKDLESLAETNYFLTTASSRFGPTGSIFTRARPGSIEDKIFQNNMDLEESFIGTKKSFDLIKNQDNVAHFSWLKYMQGLQQNLEIPFCDFKYIWKATKTSGNHFVLRKKSKYFLGLKRQLIKMIESGQLARLEKAYYLTPSSDECNPDFWSIGMDKLGSLFVLLGLSLTISSVIFLCELFKPKAFSQIKSR